jgi:hypothetical protein
VEALLAKAEEGEESECCHPLTQREARVSLADVFTPCRGAGSPQEGAEDQEGPCLLVPPVQSSSPLNLLLGDVLGRRHRQLRLRHQVISSLQFRLLVASKSLTNPPPPRQPCALPKIRRSVGIRVRSSGLCFCTNLHLESHATARRKHLYVTLRHCPL